MLILLALIFAAVVGIALHFALPERPTRGVVLAPAIATATAAVVYTALTWFGLAESNPWLWVASLLAPIAVTWPVVLVLSARRSGHDRLARERARIA